MSTAASSANLTGKRCRNRTGTSSEDEAQTSKKMKPDDDNGFSFNSMNRSRIYNFDYRKKPAELFRKDLISAMKMADSEQLNREDYLPITDAWREEWEKGVQVPVNPEAMPKPSVRALREAKSDPNFRMAKKLLKNDGETESSTSQYELDLQDLCWLECNSACDETPHITDSQLEDVINELEQHCARNMKSRQVGIEYDDHVICDVCRSPDGEEGNEMVFCDLCNICVHQACYGIQEIPDGDWLCRPCKEFGSQKTVSCVLCPNLGGALKPTSITNQWAHVSCALWVPEVSIGCVSTMEPITKIKQIPQTRWNLVCALCNVKQGAPIQCSIKTCKTAYHVICAFNHKLKMKAIVQTDGEKGVKLKSYCKRHSEKETDETENNKEEQESMKNQQEIEIATSSENNDDTIEFWKYIDINKIQQEILKKMKTDEQSHAKNLIIIDLILQYWKLKRSSNYGTSLIKLTSSAQFEEQQLQQRNEILRMRVDLERIRNLSYMICRREKVKRSWVYTHCGILEKVLTVCTETPHSKYFTREDNAKLGQDIINTSVIYDYNEKEDKNRATASIKTLRKLAKIESFHKQRPNPYAKFYSAQKRKNEAQSEKTPPKVNGTNASSLLLNGSYRKNKSPLNGLTAVQCKQLVNGISNSPLRDSHSPEKRCSPASYRQSPRSLLKPKTPPSSPNHKMEKIDKTTPVLKSPSLMGYKIPKKKQQQEQNAQSRNKIVEELNESVKPLRKKLDPQFCASLRPQNETRKLNETSANVSPKLRSDFTRYCNLDNDAIAKNERKSFSKNGKSFPQNFINKITTRAQQNQNFDSSFYAVDGGIELRGHTVSLRHTGTH